MSWTDQIRDAAYLLTGAVRFLNPLSPSKDECERGRSKRLAAEVLLAVGRVMKDRRLYRDEAMSRPGLVVKELMKSLPVHEFALVAPMLQPPFDRLGTAESGGARLTTADRGIHVAGELWIAIGKVMQRHNLCRDKAMVRADLICPLLRQSLTEADVDLAIEQLNLHFED